MFDPFRCVASLCTRVDYLCYCNPHCLMCPILLCVSFVPSILISPYSRKGKIFAYDVTVDKANTMGALASFENLFF